MRLAQTSSNGWGIREGEIGTLDETGGPAIYAQGEGSNACAHDPKPDGPRYAACGDAVTVNVAEWIGRRLASKRIESNE